MGLGALGESLCRIAMEAEMGGIYFAFKRAKLHCCT